jgi:Isoprenylcysteine carboxyl methyltransferase (ICMT) family
VLCRNNFDLQRPALPPARSCTCSCTTVSVDLGCNWSMNVQVREGHELVPRGVYSRVRHPVYAALLMAGIGLIPVLHNWIVGSAMLAVAVLFVAVRTPQEERCSRRSIRRCLPLYASHWPRTVAFSNTIAD